MKNKVFFYLFMIFLVLNIADVITATFIVKGESNPLFLMTGNFWGLVIFKFLIVYGIWWFMNRGIYYSHFYYFMCIMILLLGSLVIGLGVYSNILGMMNPQVLQTASEMSRVEKVQGYTIMISVFYIFPMALCLIGFKLYDMSYNKVRFDKEFFKKRRWWQP